MKWWDWMSWSLFSECWPFYKVRSLQGLYNHSISCLRTVSGLNLLANSVILKCKLWEEVWWGLYHLQTFFGFIGEYITPLPPSDAYFQSFLYLLYTWIKLYFTKALSDQVSSLALDWILLQRPRILTSLHSSETTFQLLTIERSYQARRKAMSKNAQTTTQLHSSHTLVK